MQSSKKWSYIIMGMYALLMGILAFYDPWLADDLEYQFICTPHAQGAGVQPIESLSDVFRSQYAHYFTTNGRTLAHLLVQLFCGLLSPPIFAFFHAIMSFLFLRLLLAVAGISLTQTRDTLLATALAGISFGTFFTPSCLIGYIWMFTLCLAFLYAFFHVKKWDFHDSFFYLSFFLLSLLAGWGHEALNFGVCFALWCYALLRSRSLSGMQWLMLLGFTLGCLLIALSPGAWSRASTTSLQPFTSSLKNALLFTRTPYVLIAYVWLTKLSCHTSWKTLVKSIALPLLGIAFLVVFNGIVAIFINRQLFGIELLSIFCILILRQRFGSRAAWQHALLIGITCVAIFVNAKRLPHCVSRHTMYEAILHYGKKAQTGDKLVVTLHKDQAEARAFFDAKTIGNFERLFADKHHKRITLSVEQMAERGE